MMDFSYTGAGGGGGALLRLRWSCSGVCLSMLLVSSRANILMREVSTSSASAHACSNSSVNDQNLRGERLVALPPKETSDQRKAQTCE